MSTEIKPGQVWAWKDDDFANGDPGQMFRIDSESDTPGHWRYVYVGVSVKVYGEASDYVASAEVINRAATLFEDATPAALDLSKVAPKDRHPEQLARFRKQVHWATDLKRGDVIVSVDAHNAVTVEREQLAPEPEPEWKPGTFGTGTLPDGRVAKGFVTVADDFLAITPTGDTAEEPMPEVTDFRPLVVIDPAAVDVDYHANRLAWGTYGIGLGQLTDAQAAACRAQVRTMLAGLGIEAP